MGCRAAERQLVRRGGCRAVLRAQFGRQCRPSLTCVITTAPPNPEVLTIPTTALAVVVVFLLYLIQRFVAPRLSAIALATYKSEIAQPLFLIIAALGAVLLVMFFPWIPYNTFGEDIKMLKDSGLSLIMILGIILAVWAASSSISEEIEGRTALTVLSKPIGRPSFILGKFLGIFWTVAVLFVVLGRVVPGHGGVQADLRRARILDARRHLATVPSGDDRSRCRDLCWRSWRRWSWRP